MRHPLWHASALSASILSFLAYNYFFIAPLYTFTVAEPYELVALLVFLVLAIMTASLSGRLHGQAEVIAERAKATQALYDFSRKLSAAAKPDDVIELLAHHASRSVKGAAMVLLQTADELRIEGAWPPEDTLSNADWAAARWAFKNEQPAGRFTSTMPHATFHYRPLGAGEKPLGVLGVESASLADNLGPAAEGELQALADLGSIAIARALLVEKSAKVRSRRQPGTAAKCPALVVVARLANAALLDRRRR